jgi:hypothetical protein
MIFSPANYSYSFVVHNNQSVICIHFTYDIKLRNALKERIKVYWSQSMKVWYCMDMPQYGTVLNLPLKEIGVALELKQIDLHKSLANFSSNTYLLKLFIYLY